MKVKITDTSAEEVDSKDWQVAGAVVMKIKPVVQKEIC